MPDDPPAAAGQDERFNKVGHVTCILENNTCRLQFRGQRSPMTLSNVQEFYPARGPGETVVDFPGRVRALFDDGATCDWDASEGVLSCFDPF